MCFYFFISSACTTWNVLCVVFQPEFGPVSLFDFGSIVNREVNKSKLRRRRNSFGWNNAPERESGKRERVFKTKMEREFGGEVE